VIDSHGRNIDYLRVSVTDRCNLRCRYCMPEEGISLLRHEDILSFEDIFEITKTAVKMGIKKVRLTGGEPLVRRGIMDLVQLLASIDGIEDLAMTTNGILLAHHAKNLLLAGLQRINVSLDTVDAERYRHITRGGRIEAVFAGIEAAQDAGLAPIKINCVVGPDSASSDVLAVREYGQRRGLQVRVIRQMTFATGCFSVAEGGTGGDCKRCNRLRLSSDGKIRPCLFSDVFFDMRKLGVVEAIQQAVHHKPKAGMPCRHTAMQAIGG